MEYPVALLKTSGQFWTGGITIFRSKVLASTTLIVEFALPEKLVALSTRHLLALRLRIRVKHEPNSRVFVGIGNS